MLLRAAQHEPPPPRAQRHRPAGRTSPVRRVRAVAAPPQLDAATGAARFGPGGAVHIDEGIIARYASFVDGARPPPALSVPSRPRPPPTPMPPLSTLAPRPAAVSTTSRIANPRAPSAPGARRPIAASSPPASPQTLHRPAPGRSPIDDQDERESDGDDVFNGAGPEGQGDRVAVCALALVLALVVGHWRRARS
nr:hypothetical protein [Pandoravirus belohorizontensis]